MTTAKTDALAGFHPLVSFVYFALVLAFTMVFTHPVMLGVALVCASAWAVALSGRKAVRLGLCALLPLMLLTAVLNPLFNHRGVTILRWLPNGNPLTLEAILYGLAAAVMLAAVIAWFSCLNRVFTTDKLLYLFGRLIPALSLLLSMTLRFVPRFAAQAKRIAAARQAAGRSGRGTGLLPRAKNALDTLSALISWALESGVATADSMRGRGYGLPGRTAWAPFRFERRDGAVLAAVALCGGFVTACGALGAFYWDYYPAVNGALLSPLTLAGFGAYTALCALPLILRGREAAKWRALRSAV